jgi:hypothetical protein
MTKKVMGWGDSSSDDNMEAAWTSAWLEIAPRALGAVSYATGAALGGSGLHYRRLADVMPGTEDTTRPDPINHRRNLQRLRTKFMFTI